MSRHGVAFAAACHRRAAPGAKAGKNEDHHPYAESKACFLQFTHTQLLIQRAAALIAEVSI
jgi:hypothetical protein